MRILIFCALFFCLSFLNAQQSVKLQLNDKTIVKDSVGMVYPYAIWQALLSKGYGIRPADPSNKQTEFILYKLSEQQLQERIQRMPKPRESTVFYTNQKIKSFKTTDINGNKIDLKALEGKIVVLNFWFIKCGPCRKEMPELNQLVDSFQTNENVVFLAVALDDRNSLNEFLKENPFRYTIIDNGRFIVDKYGVRSFPTHVILNTDGKVYFHTSGYGMNTVPWLKKSITELVKKQETVAAK